MINKCPITYTFCGAAKFSSEGLKKLSPKLQTLHDLKLDSNDLRQEAMLRAAKISIQGVQPKLSAKINVKKQEFEIVDIKGKFIIGAVKSCHLWRG